MTTNASKREITDRILKVGKKQSCTKLELNNILFPKWDDLGLLGMLLRQCVRTKEQPDGNVYDEAQFLMVMRIIGGKVLMSGRPDCYCWSFQKVQKVKSKKFIGSNSAEGMKNAALVLATISDEQEKTLFADMLASLKKDLIVATTPAESRICIEVTQEMYSSGITFCVDSWMETDEIGAAPITNLNVGDYLILEEKEDGTYVYRVGHDEFMETYSLN